MEISLDTILKTPKLSLRAVDFTDVDLVWEATRFDGFNDGMTWDPPETREDIVRITERNLEHWKQGKDYVFTIELLNPVCAIGRVGLHKESEPDTWNIGFWIHPDHWGNGYAGEASRSVLQFGFEAISASSKALDFIGYGRIQQDSTRTVNLCQNTSMSSYAHANIRSSTRGRVAPLNIWRY